jgi:hypothetical protein
VASRRLSATIAANQAVVFLLTSSPFLFRGWGMCQHSTSRMFFFGFTVPQFLAVCVPYRLEASFSNGEKELG